MATPLSSGSYVCRACRLLLASTRPASRVNAARLSQIRTSTSKSQETKFVSQRIEQLGGKEALSAFYPRIQSPRDGELLAADAAHEKLSKHGLDSEKRTFDRSIKYTVYGRLSAKRKLSSKLSFWLLHGQGPRSLQVVLNTSELVQENARVDAETLGKELQEARSKVRVGDWIAVEGYAHCTPTGELSLSASSIPQIVSPSLQLIPETVEDPEALSRHRHVERIIDTSARDVVVLRHKVIAALRSFLTDKDFVEVSTPLLGAEAGGATARPFNTYATEFKDTKLSLRIAPELYLKRLLVGNMQRVFEIGPAFRNEGVDHTHNPEFTICEFYQVMANLSSLMRMTEDLFENLVDAVHASRRKLASIPVPDDKLSFTWPTIDFISGLETAIEKEIPGFYLPDLKDPQAEAVIRELFGKLSLRIPEQANLPRLLDELASHYLESQAVGRPTWIINHPECMSPLAKSFTTVSKSGTTHCVAARAELFINGREYVNCYEEENSPVEQRRKFLAQAESHKTGPVEDIDESYVQALEYGLPPTGGWGCGVDRLVMLFAGKSRIADVLPFGTLTNVVALNADQRKRKEKSAEK